MDLIIRKQVVIIDEVRSEIYRRLDLPLVKCASIAVVKNPFLDKVIDDFSGYTEYGEKLGKILLDSALKALDVTEDKIQSYGKAAITGIDGEQEHGSALIHVGFDTPIRETIKNTYSLIPSSEKSAGPGCSIDVPLHSKVAVKVRTHFDAMEVWVQDSPHPDEIMVILALAQGSRPFPRVGGLLWDDVKNFDGMS